MLLLVDAHAHYYQCFSPTKFLEGAYANFRQAACRLGTSSGWIGIILLADPSGQRALDHLAVEPLEGWSLRRTSEAHSHGAYRSDDLRLILIGGQQIISAEGLEILALCTTKPVAERHRLVDYPALVREAGGLCVIPWGFGKWWFRRGAVVSELLNGLPGDGGVFLGDNGLRPQAFPTPRCFREHRLCILPGSDPLPFRHHAGRVGRYGIALQGELDIRYPARWLKAVLGQQQEQPLIYGSRSGMLRFVQDQAAMQWRKLAAG